MQIENKRGNIYCYENQSQYHALNRNTNVCFVVNRLYMHAYNKL